MMSREYGMTLLVSSHILGEIEQIADTIGVISNGSLIEEVSMDKIRENNTEYIEITTSDCKKAAFVLADELDISNFRVLDDNIIRIYDICIPQSRITKALILKDIDITAINRKSSSLEDYFLKLVNGGDLSA
jgi:ABC-2 type transport system ATP-binding protein